MAGEPTDGTPTTDVIVGVLAPAREAGGIGRYTAQLNDHIAAETAVTVRHHPLHEGLGPGGYLRGAAAATRDDVVHLQFEYGLFRPKLLFGWLFLPVLFVLSRLRSTPVTVTVHEVWTPATVGRLQYGYVWLFHAALSLVARKVVFMTASAERDYRPLLGADATRIPHGVDVSGVRDIEEHEAREAFGLDPANIVVSQIGYVSPRKGTDDFLALAERHPDHEFLLAGGPLRGEDEAYFKSVTENAPENVHVTGVLSDKNFHRAIVATDVAILAYRDIRQSGILNWCFAYGVPAVCRAIERFENLDTEGAPLVLFGEDDCDYLAIDEALESALDRRNSLSRSMRDFGREHDLSAVAEKYAMLYERLA